jgi:prolyl-tRNA synthetase
VVDAGIKLDEVVKTLVVRTNDDFVALALNGQDRVDFKKVRKLLGLKTELAKPEEVLAVVGVPIGAVCPVKIGIPVYFDRKVLGLKNVHMGSGDLKHGLEMKLIDLLKAIGEYQIEELT